MPLPFAEKREDFLKINSYVLLFPFTNQFN